MQQSTGSSTTVEASNFTYNTNGNTTGETTTTYSTETQNGTSFDVRTTLTKAYSYDYTDMMSAATVSQSVDAKISGTSDPYTNSASDSASDTYVYNGDGQRVKKITGGVTTKYYYTGSVVLYTADADNNKISGNIATPDGQIIATRDYANATNSDGSANTFANNYYFYHYDIRGSVTTLLKPDATIEQGYSYDEYGNATVESADRSSPKKYLNSIPGKKKISDYFHKQSDSKIYIEKSQKKIQSIFSAPLIS